MTDATQKPQTDRAAPEGILGEVSSYWDTRSEGYDAQVQKEEDEGAIARYLPDLGEVRGRDVLDIGCGPGFFACALARAGARVTACDISPEMLEKTSARARAQGLEVSVRRLDAQALPFAEGSFDLVCSRNVVWNLEHPREAYRQWLSVLRPGGRIVVFDGNHYRHYFDAAYARARKAPLPQDNHILLGVSTSKIDALARSLPLGRVERPQWDEKTLLELGAASASSRVLSTITDPEDGRALVFDFVVTALKGA